MNKNLYVIILNFNSCSDTLQCIESLNEVDNENFNIIVVDNCSMDNSIEVLSSEAEKQDFVFLRSSGNLGYANGNNIGIKYALQHEADYVCILNSDVKVHKNFLKPLLKLLEDEQVGIVGPCICDYNKPDIVQAMGANINLYRGLAMGSYKGVPYKELKHKFYDVDYIGGACFICKREVFEKIGLIPENYFLFYEETEFCLKAKEKGYKLICASDSIVYHKGSATISKFVGLSYYFLNKNRIVFMRRNSNISEKIIFVPYLFIETIGRIIIRREPWKLFKYYIDGFKSDVNSMDTEKISFFTKKI
ncbi:MAG: putative glycosyltransferase [Clostridiaceae bacterium]|jgi:GT2 family glycosyltransferase|nr:putative glycosyltransferase [Clostridiaceae bacterium]